MRKIDRMTEMLSYKVFRQLKHKYIIYACRKMHLLNIMFLKAVNEKGVVMLHYIFQA